MTDDAAPRPLGEILAEQVAELTARLAQTGSPIYADHPEYPEFVEAPACARCRGAGWLRKDVPANHPDFGRLFECGCGVAVARRIKRAWDSAGIPKRLAEASFDAYPVSSQTADVLELIRAVWLDDAPSWLCLMGPSGRGKSGLAVSAIRELIERGQSALFVPAPNLFDRIRQTWDETLGVKEHEVLAAVRDVDVLVIDDLGKEQATDWVKTRLFVLLNDRYAAERRTIITTNFNEQDLAARVGEPVMSRIEDAAGTDAAYVLRLDGPNLRGRAA